jgi:integrase
MGAPAIEALLTRLVIKENVAASTQNQALQPILFVYREVLRQPVEKPIHTLRVKKAKRLPTELTRQDVQQLFAHLSGAHLLMVRIRSGSGLRRIERLRLRVNDLDFPYQTNDA